MRKFCPLALLLLTYTMSTTSGFADEAKLRSTVSKISKTPYTKFKINSSASTGSLSKAFGLEKFKKTNRSYTTPSLFTGRYTGSTSNSAIAAAIAGTGKSGSTGLTLMKTLSNRSYTATKAFNRARIR